MNQQNNNQLTFKVLIIHNRYQITGGEVSVVFNESELLKNQGHEVQVIFFDNKDISGIYTKIKTAVGSLYNLASKSEISSQICEFNPDIIHVHNFFPQVSPSIFFLAGKLNIPIVHTIHNFRLICPSATLMRDGKVCHDCINKPFASPSIKHKCYRNSAILSSLVSTINLIHNQLKTFKNRIDGFIFLTDSVKTTYLNSHLYLEKEKLFVKPNFVNEKGFNYNRKEHFLFVGRLSTEKGIDVLLKAFQNTPHHLKIIGTGPLKEKVISAASRNDHIKYLGKQPSNIVIEEMKQCKALIFPSIFYEGMPVTIIEAFSTGCPVIASKLGAMEELIEHEINGLHFEAGSVSDLIKQLGSITDEMSLNARQSYLEHYTPEANYQQLINIYQKVIDENAAHH